MTQENSAMSILRMILAVLSIVGVVFLIIMMAGGIDTDLSRVETWNLSLIITILTFLSISTWASNIPTFLIDSRNKVSLSRLQMAIWSILIFSAIGVALGSNIQATIVVTVSGVPEVNSKIIELENGSILADLIERLQTLDDKDDDNLIGIAFRDLDPNLLLENGDQYNITEVEEESEDESDEISYEVERIQNEDKRDLTIPSEIWLLLGISTTSLIASPLLKSVRSEQTPNPITRNAHMSDAKWTDLFRGEEESNDKKTDLAKVQMIYLTVVIVVAYAIAIHSMFQKADGSNSFITTFPLVSPGIVALLGISHVGYLSYKVTGKAGKGLTITAEHINDASVAKGSQIEFKSSYDNEEHRYASAQDSDFIWQITCTPSDGVRFENINSRTPKMVLFESPPLQSVQPSIQALPLKHKLVIDARLAVFSGNASVYTSVAKFEIDTDPDAKITRIDI